jgi:hypothetical protein
VVVALLAVKYVSVISVLANLALALITATMAFRIYKSVLAAVNKSQDGHPFKVSYTTTGCEATGHNPTYDFDFQFVNKVYDL